MKRTFSYWVRGLFAGEGEGGAGICSNREQHRLGSSGRYTSPRSCARFDALMAEFGRNVELPEEDLMSNWTDSCNMTVADLKPETKAAVYERPGRRHPLKLVHLFMFLVLRGATFLGDRMPLDPDKIMVSLFRCSLRYVRLH